MRSLRTPHHLANEIRLHRTQHRGSFLLVEGADDGRFYRRFIDPRNCHLLVGLNKDLVTSAIRLLDADNFEGAIGLVDADFDALDGTAVPSSNIVRTEFHDLEAQLVRSTALDMILEEYASPEKLRRFEGRYGAPLRNWIIETARPLGYLRWHSIRAGLNLRFEGLHFPRFVNARTLELDAGALCNQIRNQSQNHSLSDTQLLAISWPANRPEDPWQLCCGHDLVELTTLALRQCVGSRQRLTTEEVRRGLRLAFSEHDFHRSQLRALIARWESQKGFRVLAQR